MLKNIKKKPLSKSAKLAKYTFMHPNYSHQSTDLTAVGSDIITVECLEHGLFTVTAREHGHQIHTCPDCKQYIIDGRSNIQLTKERKVMDHWLTTMPPVTYPLTVSLNDIQLTLSCAYHGRIGKYTPKDLPDELYCVECRKYESYTFANNLIRDTKTQQLNSLPLVSSANQPLSYSFFAKPYPATKQIMLTVTCKKHGQFSAGLVELHQGLANCPVCKEQHDKTN